MSRSVLFQQLRDYADAHPAASKIDGGPSWPFIQLEKDPERLSSEGIIRLMQDHDTATQLTRYHPSISQYEVLKALYGTKDQINVSEEDPEYLRYITPFVRVTSEGAFFLLHVRVPEGKKIENPRYKDVTMLAFHPSAELIVRAINGDRDAEGEVLTLPYIQEHPEKYRPIQVFDVYEGRPADVQNVKEKLRDAENMVFKTDNDRLLAEWPHTDKNPGEWRNKRAMYYLRKTGETNEEGEPLYNIILKTTRGRASIREFDDKNSKAAKDFLGGGIPKRIVETGVTKDEASQIVEADFNSNVVPHLISGADPIREFNRASGKFGPLGLAEFFYGLRRMFSDFYLEATQDNSQAAKEFLSIGIFRGAGKFFGRAGGAVFQDFLQEGVEVLISMFSVVASALKNPRVLLPLLGVGGGAGISLGVADFAVYAFVGVAALGAMLMRKNDAFTKSYKHDLYEKIVMKDSLHNKMQADAGRYPIDAEVLSYAHIVRDYEIAHSDLREGNGQRPVLVPDHLYERMWDQHHKLEDYSPTSLPKGAVMRVIKLRNREALFTESPNGDFRIFIPKDNITIQWRELDNVIPDAGPVSRYRERKFAGENCDNIYIMRHKGVSDFDRGEPFIEETVIKKENWEELAVFLKDIAIRSLEEEPQPYQQAQDNTVPVKERPGMVMRLKRAWRRAPVNDDASVQPESERITAAVENRQSSASAVISPRPFQS